MTVTSDNIEEQKKINEGKDSCNLDLQMDLEEKNVRFKN